MANRFCKCIRLVALLCIGLLANEGLLSAQDVITVKQNGEERQVLVLPYNYTIDNKMIEKKAVKAVHIKKGSAGFYSQLADAVLKTVNTGGNVFRISRMQDHNQRGDYKIWGTAYHTDEYEQLKAKALEEKNRRLENGKYAYLVVYRPEYNYAANDEISLTITINDTLNLELKAKTKYLIRIDKNCKVKVANKNNILVQEIDVQPGNYYYVRAYTNVPWNNRLIKDGGHNTEVHGYAPYFERIDGMQGDLESSLVNEITVTKKL